jgi:hypothetical protein
LLLFFALVIYLAHTSAYWFFNFTGTSYLDIIKINSLSGNTEVGEFRDAWSLERQGQSLICICILLFVDLLLIILLLYLFSVLVELRYCMYYWSVTPGYAHAEFTLSQLFWLLPAWTELLHLFLLYMVNVENFK